MLKYALLLYMSILALAGAASLCTSGTVLEGSPSQGDILLFVVLLGSVHGNINECSWVPVLA